MTIEEILSLPYKFRTLRNPDGRFTADIEEFPGCVAEGDSREEALAALDRVAASWIEAAVASNFPIPEPSEEPEASGRLLLRLPRGMHARAIRAAGRDGVSLNQFICCALAESLGERNGAAAVAKVVREELREPRVIRIEAEVGHAATRAASLLVPGEATFLQFPDRSEQAGGTPVADNRFH